MGQVGCQCEFGSKWHFSAEGSGSDRVDLNSFVSFLNNNEYVGYDYKQYMITIIIVF